MQLSSSQLSKKLESLCAFSCILLCTWGTRLFLGEESLLTLMRLSRRKTCPGIDRWCVYTRTGSKKNVPILLISFHTSFQEKDLQVSTCIFFTTYSLQVMKLNTIMAGQGCIQDSFANPLQDPFFLLIIITLPDTNQGKYQSKMKLHMWTETFDTWLQRIWKY